MQKIINLLCGMSLCFFMSSSYAASTFHLSTLFLAGNENGNGIFTVSNTSTNKLYLKAEVNKIQVKDGEVVKIPLTRDNFPLWDLAVNPSKVIMNPSEVKDFAVKYLCEKNCPRDQDLVYQIRFTPVQGEGDSEENVVDIAFGMAPYYVVPAVEQNVDYTFDYNEENGTIEVTNTGNTFIKMEVNSCPKNTKITGKCRRIYNLLAGRYRTIELPKDFISSNTTVQVANHDQSIQKEFSL